MNGDVEVRTPGGWFGRLSGVDTRTVLMLIVISISTALVLWEFDRARHQHEQDSLRFLEQHKLTQQLLGSIVSNQTAVINEVKHAAAESSEVSQSVIYVLTLNQAERERLKLTMPPALRKQMNGRQ